MSADPSNAGTTSGGGSTPSSLVRVLGAVRNTLGRWKAQARALVTRAARATARALWPEWLVGAAIVLVCLLVFRNTLHNTYALDDYYRVVDNPGIQQFWPPARHFVEPRTMSTLDRITQYRPLLPLSLSIDYAIGGNSVVTHHVGNLLLQIVASLLAFLLALELLRHWTAVLPGSRLKTRLEFVPMSDTKIVMVAGFAAVLFAIHPVSGIAVNYVSARDLLLMQVFFLGALLAYARMRRLGENVNRWNIVLALLALSLLSKTNLVIAPLLWIAFDVLLARDSLRDRRVWLRASAVAAVVVAFFVVTRLMLGFSDLQHVLQAGGSWLTYALTQARLHLFHYLPHVWWPFPIRLLPQIEPGNTQDFRVWLGIVFLLATLALAWRLRRSTPLVAFCIVAYWILMVPESSFLPFHQVAADYRPYPASIFLFLALCLTAVRFLSARRSALVLGFFTLYLAAISTAMNRHWRTGETLWSHSVNHGGDPIAHMNLAMSIADRSDPRVRQNLEEALRLNPNYVLAHINLCLLQVELGETDGLKRCEHAVQLQPDWAQSHYWLATAYQRAGRPWDAMHASLRAVQLDPNNVEYHYQAALDAQRVRDWTGSLEHVHQVRARVVNYKELGFVRGFALQMLRRNEEAVVEYRRQLATIPNHVQVTFNTGYALMALGRCAEAGGYFEKTLELRPGYAEARYYLDRCRRTLAAATRSEVRLADRAAPRAARAKPVRKRR